MARLDIDNLSKHFGTTVAVQQTTHQFADEKLTVLVGPSGCGKTTLLRMIAGLEKPTSGRIILNEKRVEDRPAWDRDIAMVFQNYALYPHMTVEQNIAFPLIAQSVKRTDRIRRAGDVARQLQIDHLLTRKPRELSGGQQQRVALGRALIRQPSVFLMDEPLSNLDASLRNDTRTEIKHLQQQLGITTLYVTHDQTEAMTLADQLIVMNDGQVQQIGTPNEVYRQPNNIFVASFIGEPPMNIVPYDHANIPAYTMAHLNQQYADTDIGYVGVRPEALQIGWNDRPTLRGTVYTVEPIGRETIVTLQLNDTLIKVITAPDDTPRLHDIVALNVASDALHIFDKSGNLLFQETWC